MAFDLGPEVAEREIQKWLRGRSTDGEINDKKIRKRPSWSPVLDKAGGMRVSDARKFHLQREERRKREAYLKP